MSRKKTTDSEVEVVEEAAPAPVATPPVPAPRKYTFEQWANIRGVKPHHRAGMRAFVSRLFPRSLDAWDHAFKSY